jgi:catechol 2,3-dioxygenase-like lactoylglutathione lyase family enzyme
MDGGNIRLKTDKTTESHSYNKSKGGVNMKIYQINVRCFDILQMKRFYTETLEMPIISESASHFSVMAGTSKLVFEQDTKTPYYHLCFRTCSDFFDHMYQKLMKKNLLLPDEQGEFSLFWQGKQAYFTDPDGNILELLERPFYWEGDAPDFGWYDIGEIGMPVKEISDMQNKLGPYIQDQQKSTNETFAFYGDQEGVFVLVKEGRNWYPTERRATIHPIKAIVSGVEEGHFVHQDLPYEIIIRKEWNAGVPAVQFRIARPTNQMEKIVDFYQNGLGLKKIGGFCGHDGYDGVMFGAPGNSYHLEFTQSQEMMELPKPTKEHLLVFYIPNTFELRQIVHKLAVMGYYEVAPENPYWGRGGVTIEDPDGWRIVLMNTAGI